MAEREMRAFIIFISIFAASLAIASVLASKIINVFGIFVPAGILAYCITFVCSDVISEIWGKKRAKQTVFAGFIALLIILVLVKIALIAPTAPFWQGQDSFNAILGATPRIILASLVAYLLSQYHDVWAFHFLKAKTNGNHLWLRNNASTAVSQFIDSFVFITIAFYGILPIWPLIFGQWIIKFAIAAIDTPVIYFFVWILRDKMGIKENDAKAVA
jgi:queuosine precursor transporter